MVRECVEEKYLMKPMTVKTLGCKPDILVKTWCTGLGAGD